MMAETALFFKTRYQPLVRLADMGFFDGVLSPFFDGIASLFFSAA
jgi:hypothetical protein